MSSGLCPATPNVPVGRIPPLIYGRIRGPMAAHRAVNNMHCKHGTNRVVSAPVRPAETQVSQGKEPGLCILIRYSLSR